MKTKKMGNIAVGLIFLAIAVGGLFLHNKVMPISGQPMVAEEHKGVTSDETTFFPEGGAEDVVSNDDGYELVVGANPSIGSKQKFSPPTNSVVVTNEAQLQLLIEQAKESRQTVQK